MTGLLDATQSQLLIVDVQERLIPAMAEFDQALPNIARLAHVARVVAAPITISEQYPKGLGATLSEVREACGAEVPVFSKMHFSCARDPALAERLLTLGRRQIVICGIEAHVCVLQSAIDLKARDAEVFVVVDAVASRHGGSKEIALRRLVAAGVVVATTEMVAFEWLERAGTDAFRAIAPLLR